MSGPQPLPSENDEYVPHEFASSQDAERLLQPSRRSFVGPIIIFIAGVVLGAIGFSRTDLLKRPSQNEAPIPPKQPERFSERTIEPFKSLMWPDRTSILEVFLSVASKMTSRLSADLGPERTSLPKPSLAAFTDISIRLICEKHNRLGAEGVHFE